MHRRAEVGGAECERIKLRTAALSSSALHRLCPLVVYGFSVGEGGGGVAVLCRESPASNVTQAGKEGEGQNVNYCPPPFYTLHRLCLLAVRLLYARALLARRRWGCLFWEKDSAVAGLVHAFDSWQRCVWSRTHRTTRKSWPAFLAR